MGEFSVKINELRQSASEESRFVSELGNIEGEIRQVKNNLRWKILAESQIQTRISNLVHKSGLHCNGMQGLNNGLDQSIAKYVVTESKLMHGDEGSNLHVIQPEIHSDDLIPFTEYEKDKKDNGIDFSGFFGNFMSNAKDSLRDALFESSGKTLVRTGGLINVATSTARGVGENAFVIVDPNVAQKTSKLISAGGNITKAAKVGLPIIGGIIDFATQKGRGVRTDDALVKSTAHVAIGLAGGWAAGQAGAALGAAVGSVVPVAGTVVGAAVGFVGGVAISTVGNMAFDYIYDNGLSTSVHAMTDSVKTTVTNWGDSLAGFWENNIGLAVS